MDGFRTATVSDDGARPYAAKFQVNRTIILPLPLLLRQCRVSLDAISRLLKLPAEEALMRIVRAMDPEDYGHAVSAARTLLVDRRRGLTPTQDEIFAMIDALSDIHRTFHEEVQRITGQPHRRLFFQRKAGSDGLIFDAVY